MGIVVLRIPDCSAIILVEDIVLSEVPQNSIVFSLRC
jgi:hypothetical protein